jgi:septal ring factor EnvC (AmiA/AmiB activator)
MKRFFTLSFLAAFVAASGLFGAPDAASAESRLRDSLKASMLQLRTAQNDLAGAQSARDALAAEKKELETEIAGLKKQIVADRIESDKAIAALKATNAAQATELVSTNEELVKTRASLAKVVDYAKKTEIERNERASRVVQLETQVELGFVRNMALYTLGNEILERYSKYSLGDAIGAREPFIAVTRAKLDIQVQDYADKLKEQHLKTPAPEAP